jgi:hypothetical protein
MCAAAGGCVFGSRGEGWKGGPLCGQQRHSKAVRPRDRAEKRRGVCSKAVKRDSSKAVKQAGPL